MTQTPADPNVLKGIAHRAMLQRGLLPDFPAAALEQARAMTAPAAPDGAEFRDLRELLWASIDNDDSRDLDQLCVAQPLAEGVVKIFVAIADVDALVRKDSPIDAHARHNTTSVYTVPEIFPMLPEKLSTDLTSLGECVDRVSIVIEMTVGPDGDLRASDVYGALVRNRAKLAYGGVGAWLSGQAPAPARVASLPGLDRQLRLQDEVAQALRKIRFAHGALSLETIEARPIFDAGLLTSLKPEEKNRASELIEDFMIAANGVTAQYLARKGLPSLRRVLRTPKKWSRIVEVAAGLGEALPAAPSAQALSAFLAKRRRLEPASFPDLSLCVIKLLGRGEYVVDMPGQPVEGHFGLAVNDYTHSTAPNRRFPDLLTQRLLKAALTARPVEYAPAELQSLAAHCTMQEDNAAKVERQVSKSAAALLLSPHVGQRFEAIVTGAADKGTWVRISGPTTEGKLVRGFEGLDVGDAVRVVLVRTDVERGFIDFERIR